MASTLQPAASPAAQASAAELDAILHRAVIAPIADRAFLRITGSDATRWLNGMVTNNIQTLAPGEGNYNFLLSAQGRILGDCTIYREPTPDPPSFLLETDASQIDTIQPHLDRFIIMDDVELAPMEPAPAGFLLIGPESSSPLVSAADSPPPKLSGRAARINLSGHDALVISRPCSQIPAFEVWFQSAAAAEHSFRTFKTAVENEASPASLEAFRILSGTPRYGIDIRNTDSAHDLPQETAPEGAQHPALHFAKGCYLGQEIVERIRSRGNLHRAFSGFELQGELPASGTPLTADGKPAGELTSVAIIPLPATASTPGRTRQLALGYIRREARARNLPLEYPGGTATPVGLPFKLP